MELDFYRIVSLAAASLLIFVLLLMVGTLSHHARTSIRLRRRLRRAETLVPSLCRALGDLEAEADFVAQVRPSDHGALLPALLQLSLDLRGDEQEAVTRVADAMGLCARERKRLRSWRAAERAEGAKNLGLLHVEAALPALLDALGAETEAPVRLAALMALGEIGGRDALRGLLGMLEDHDPGLVRRAQEVLLSSASDATAEIESYVRECSVPEARRAAVEVLGVLRDPRSGALLAELVGEEDAEMRIKATKALASIGDPGHAATLRRLLDDPVWEVRCQAVRGLGALGDLSAVPWLAEALSDDAWWVRFKAALGLAELGPPGVDELRAATQSTHPLRREVARYVLDRTQMGGMAA